MKKSWEVKELGDVIEIRNGRNQQQVLSKNGQYPIMGSAGNLMGYATDYICEAGTTIIGRKGNISKPIFINERFWNVDTAFGFYPKDEKETDKKIIYYLCLSIDFAKMNRGTTIPSLVKSELQKISIQLPLITEQRRIVSVLDEAFANISKAKDKAEQNLKNAKELLESYLQSVFTNKGDDWEEVKLSEIAKVTGGHSFKSGDFSKQGKYQVIRIGNVRNGIIRTNESPVFIDNPLNESVLKKALLSVGDLIITQTGTKNKRDYGYTVIIDKENYLLNQRIASIRFGDNYLPKFFLYFSWTNFFKDQYFENETGTVGQGNVGITAITDANVPLLPITQQKIIVKKIDELSIQTKRLEAIYEQKLKDLEELKKSILQKAFNGEL